MTSRETIIKQIIDLENRGAALASTAIEQTDPDLLRIATQVFGTWETALRYAGVSLRRLDLKWNLNSVGIINRLREKNAVGEDMRATYQDRQDHDFYLSVRRAFGTWRTALLAAGIKPPERNRPFVPTARQRVLEEISNRVAEGLSLRLSDVRR
ncbi:MAG: hypothetical protein KDA83_19045, partial [Planctomycetales bacterium]|nr:hypothetical protein [Planctomycetales bacterium]